MRSNPEKFQSFSSTFEYPLIEENGNNRLSVDTLIILKYYKTPRETNRSYHLSRTSLSMKFFAAIVLLTVPLVMADNTVDSGSVKASAKDEAHALYADIEKLYTSQESIAQGHYSDALEQISKEYRAIREDRWYTLRNLTIDEVTTKVKRVVTDALNIGVDLRKEFCYEQYESIVSSKRQQGPESELKGCVFVAYGGEKYNAAQIANYATLEIYTRIQSTAKKELETCDGAAAADPCYDAVVKRLEMFKGRMINAGNEIRVVYATELAGHVDGCDGSVVLSLTEWQTQTLKYITNCASYAIKKIIGQRNLGMDA